MYPTKTLVVEDGTGVSTANSLSTRAEADEHLASIRMEHSDLWFNEGLTDEHDKEMTLIRATELFQYCLQWRGIKRFATQGTPWPRLGAVDGEGYAIAENVVPGQVKLCHALLAFELRKYDPIATTVTAVTSTTTGQVIKSAQVEELRVEYFEPSEALLQQGDAAKQQARAFIPDGILHMLSPLAWRRGGNRFKYLVRG